MLLDRAIRASLQEAIEAFAETEKRERVAGFTVLADSMTFPAASAVAGGSGNRVTACVRQAGS